MFRNKKKSSKKIPVNTEDEGELLDMPEASIIDANFGPRESSIIQALDRIITN